MRQTSCDEDDEAQYRAIESSASRPWKGLRLAKRSSGVNVVDLSQLAGQLGDVQPYAPPEHGPDDLATLLYSERKF